MTVGPSYWRYAGIVRMFALSVGARLDAILTVTITASFVSEVVVVSSIGGAFGGVVGTHGDEPRPIRSSQPKTASSENHWHG